MRVRVICSLRLLSRLMPVETSGLGIRHDRDLAMDEPARHGSPQPWVAAT